MACVEPSLLVPRGGGAFLAEIDGNLTAWRHDDDLIEFHHDATAMKTSGGRIRERVRERRDEYRRIPKAVA